MGNEISAWRCPILHVDMDAFYASVMTRGRPELAQVPVIVGGGHRGVVLSANYVARGYGVTSAMPMMRAQRRCPDAVVLAPDYEAFSQVSTSVMEIFRQVTPRVDVVSMDEAFLDVTGASRHYSSPQMVAEQLRYRVFDEQGITCSVGGSHTLALAKLGSRRAKPDGIYFIPPDAVTARVHPLPVGELWGVGPQTVAALERLGLKTVGQVAHCAPEVLQRVLGLVQGKAVHDLAWGRSSAVVQARRGSHEPEKSMGADQTFGRDTDDPELIRRELLRLTHRVTSRMRAARLVGRTVTLRVRFADFHTVTRSRTRSEATDVTQEIFQAATELFGSLNLQRARIRLVGVRVEGLIPRETAYRQHRLGEREKGWSEADHAMDQVRLRFGSGVLAPATLIRNS